MSEERIWRIRSRSLRVYRHGGICEHLISMTVKRRRGGVADLSKSRGTKGPINRPVVGVDDRLRLRFLGDTGGLSIVPRRVPFLTFLRCVGLAKLEADLCLGVFWRDEALDGTGFRRTGELVKGL